MVNGNRWRQLGRSTDLTSRLLAFVTLLSFQATAAEIADDRGYPVVLDHEAQRIVTLSPHTTELVIAAGLENALVGIADGSAVPPSLQHLPLVGGVGTVDRELLTNLRPDLVVAWHSGNRASDLDWLARKQNIALYRSEPTSMQEIADSIRALGKLGGTAMIAEHSAQAFEHAIDNACTRLPPKRVYVEVWPNPPMTVGGQHWINDALSAAGFRNHFVAESRGVFTIADEARFAVRDLPLISLVRGFDNSPNDQLADKLSIPGPRLAEAIQMLCLKRLQEATP